MEQPSSFPKVFAQELSYVCHRLRQLGVPAAHVEDLAQDVFVTAFQRFGEYDSARPMRPWLFGIAFRVASAFRNRAHVQREVGGELPEVAHEGAGPEQQLAESRVRADVLRSLDSLDNDRRAVFVLHDLDGMPVPEAAELLGIPVNTAYTRLRAARARFTEEFRRIHGGEV